MTEQIEIPSFWKNSINFKAYKLDRSLNYEELIEILRKNGGNLEQNKKGWLAKYPHFKTNDKNIASFIYVNFKKNTRASRHLGFEVIEPEYFGFTFYFSYKLIIVSTSNNFKLSYLVERDAFTPIRTLTNISGCGYSGDFLFWLAYRFDTDNRKINNDIIIDDITAISSSHENLNLQDAVSSNTRVTKHIETQIILGLNKFATATISKFKSNGNYYTFNLYFDGRVKAKHAEVETKEEKVMYAKQIHDIIQSAHEEYNKIADVEEWRKLKDDFSRTLLESGLSRLKEYVVETK